MKERVTGFIPAGGEGRRLKPLTDRWPKPALLMGSESKRIIDFPLDLLEKRADNVIVSTGYFPGILETYLESREDPSLIVFQDRGLWNIGGSLLQHYERMVKDDLLSDNIIVIPGDHVIEGLELVELVRFHEENKADVSAVVINFKPYGDYLSLREDGSIACQDFLGRGGKCYNSTGIYVFRTDYLLDRIKREIERGWNGGEFDLTKKVVFPAIGKDLVFGFLLGDEFSYWDDAGTVLRYFHNNMRLSHGGNIIAANSSIGEQVTLEHTIVLDRVRLIGKCKMVNVVVSPYTVGEDIIARGDPVMIVSA